MISPARMARGVTAGFAAMVLGSAACLGLGAGASAASQPPGVLSRVVVARALPGFALLPHGQFDGPIAKASLNSYSVQPQWHQDVADGRLTGFIRAWGHVYQRGPAIIYMSALRLPDAADDPLFTSSIGTLASKQPAATTFAVKGVTGATGYQTSPPVQVGTVTGDWIIFTRGDIGFFLYAVAPPRTLSQAQLESVASRQAARAPGG